MPRMTVPPDVSVSAVIMSQVDVPITFTRVPGLIPAPTAPIWQSIAPMATLILPFSPSLAFHSSDNVPMQASEVSVPVYMCPSKTEYKGSMPLKKPMSGSPPHSMFHIALCPAQHLLLCIVCADILPVSTDPIQSQCSAHDHAASFSSWELLRQWSIFAHAHSQEYEPPQYFV